MKKPSHCSSAQIKRSDMPSLVMLIGVSSVLLLSACTTPRTTPATVIDRSRSDSSASAVSSASIPTPPGYYRVKRGDTVLRIALDQGQSYRDIVRWNNLTDPNLIEVDQLLLVRPPAGKMTVKPLTSAAATPAPQKMADPAAEPKIEAVKPDAPPPGIRLSWPAKGKVVEDFVDGKNKGIDIAGKLGDPIQAASDGKVVYAGNSLRGYGNLVIVKHDNTYLTAYAHNRNLLVKEGDSVRKGQTIAEMGDTDANSVRLHFELRVNGKPVDPLPFLQ
ncbi:MAG: peptidoglycan DD-metalloendopeptidase family protein [Polynucleobacter sp.]|nr:peptidoglycan DD-metalloendopeptidase family protein [Polynucleobacter sp.]